MSFGGKIGFQTEEFKEKEMLRIWRGGGERV